MNSKANFAAGAVSVRRTAASAAPTSAWGSARWCTGLESTFGSAAPTASPAGLWVRWPWAMAYFMTCPMRSRSRRAVSCFTIHIG